MGRRATNIKGAMSREKARVCFLWFGESFHVAILSQTSYSRKLAHWAQCLHLGVDQVVPECTSILNGLTGQPARLK